MRCLLATATYLTTFILRFPEASLQNRAIRTRVHRLVWSLIILTLVPSIYLTWRLIQQTIFEERLRTFIQNELQYPSTYPVDHRLVQRRDSLILEIALLGQPISASEIQRLEHALQAYKLAISDIQVVQAETPKEGTALALLEWYYGQCEERLARLTDSLQQLNTQIIAIEEASRETPALL